jgi:hypothetical protein
MHMRVDVVDIGKRNEVVHSVRRGRLRQLDTVAIEMVNRSDLRTVGSDFARTASNY